MSKPTLLSVDSVIKEALTLRYTVPTEPLSEVRQVIEGALRILDSAEHWCQNHDAVDTRQMVMKPIAPDKSFIMNYKVNPSEVIQTVMIPKPVDPRMPEANAFCAQGAVIRSLMLMNLAPTQRYALDYNMVLFNQVMSFVSQHVPEEWREAQAELQCESKSSMANIVRYNDHKDTTFEDVRLVFKRALHSLDD